MVFPPKPYDQNANECINSMVNPDLKTKKTDPFDFVNKMEKIVKRQENEVKLALIGRGEYSLKPEYQIC